MEAVKVKAIEKMHIQGMPLSGDNFPTYLIDPRAVDTIHERKVKSVSLVDKSCE